MNLIGAKLLSNKPVHYIPLLTPRLKVHCPSKEPMYLEVLGNRIFVLSPFGDSKGLKFSNIIKF